MIILGINMPLIWWGFALLALLIVILIISNLMLYIRMRRFQSSHIALNTYMSGYQLDSLLQENLQKIAEQSKKIEQCFEKISPIEQKLRLSVDHAELIRFRAFENVGSDLSFALALLNQEGNGVVLSSIHTREESRVYAKPVQKWESSYMLTNEEKEVINKASHCYKI